MLCAVLPQTNRLHRRPVAVCFRGKDEAVEVAAAETSQGAEGARFWQPQELGAHLRADAGEVGEVCGLAEGRNRGNGVLGIAARVFFIVHGWQ